MRRNRLSLVVLLATACLCRPLSSPAQTVYSGGDSSQPVVLMPRPVAAEVLLPAGVQEAPRVVLKLHLSELGTVLDAELVSGDAPFSTLALQSAEVFRFEPAKRGQTAIPCRILYEVVWRKTVPIESEPVLRAPKMKPKMARPETAKASKPELEVLVQGQRTAPGAQSLTAAEARETPGSFGDPLRAVDALPSVSPVVSGLPYFYVRGAPPGNVGYFVDGVRVPLLWHALVGPSVLHPATLQKVTLYRGAYPAQYGRYAGAIVTADAASVSPELEGEAGVRLIDAALMGKSGLGSLRSFTPEATVLVAGRYSYTGLAMSQFSSKVDLGYWDYQTMVRVPVSKHSSIGLLGLGAYDYLATSSSTSKVQYHRADLRFDHSFDTLGGLRVAVTAGRDDVGSAHGNVRDDLLAARAEVERRLGARVVLRGGADVVRDSYQLTLEEGVRYQTAAILGNLLPTRIETTFGTHLGLDYFPTTRIQFTPGLRVDRYNSQGRSQTAVEPRASARFRLSRRVTTEHSLGLAHQATIVIPGVPAAQLVSLKDGLQRALVASSGFTVQWDDYTTSTLSAFESIYQNLSDPLGTTHQLTFDVSAESERVRGAAYGLELYVKRRLHQRVGGYVSYTLSRTTRSNGRLGSLSALDRTHVANAAVAVDAGRRWHVGARVSALSGLPVRVATNFGNRYDGDRRTPAFFRLDLRVEKRWVRSEKLWWAAVFELMNATMAEEVTELSCNEVRCTKTKVGPIVMPSVGAQLHF